MSGPLDGWSVIPGGAGRPYAVIPADTHWTVVDRRGVVALRGPGGASAVSTEEQALKLAGAANAGELGKP